MSSTHPTAPPRDQALDDTLRSNFPASAPSSVLDSEPANDEPPRTPPPPQTPARRWTDKLDERHRAELDVA